MGSVARTSPEIINHLHETDKRWFAIYTKYKCEKYVVDQLQKKGIDGYVPLLSVTKEYTRKRKTYQLPLINSYVFVCITKDQYIKVLETEYVFKFIKQRKNLIAIPEIEINLLKKIVGEYQEEISISPSYYAIGEAVEIIAGSLTGLKGFLVDMKNKKEFVVQLDHIGIQLRLNINPAHLRSVRRLV